MDSVFLGMALSLFGLAGFFILTYFCKSRSALN